VRQIRPGCQVKQPHPIVEYVRWQSIHISEGSGSSWASRKEPECCMATLRHGRSGLGLGPKSRISAVLSALLLLTCFLLNVIFRMKVFLWFEMLYKNLSLHELYVCGWCVFASRWVWEHYSLCHSTCVFGCMTCVLAVFCEYSSELLCVDGVCWYHDASEKITACFTQPECLDICVFTVFGEYRSELLSVGAVCWYHHACD
jgi:hypothetical protein